MLASKVCKQASETMKHSMVSDVDSEVDCLVRRVKAEVRNILLPRDYDLNIFQYEKNSSRH